MILFADDRIYLALKRYFIVFKYSIHIIFKAEFLVDIVVE
jgi:hypothetical protein